MIELVRDALSAAGVAAGAADFDYNVYVGRTPVIHVFAAARFLFTAKLSHDPVLEREYRATQEARAALGGLVPEPVAFRRCDPLAVALWRAVEHSALTPRLAAARSDVLRVGLNAYFTAGRQKFAVAAPAAPHAVRLGAVVAGLRRDLPQLAALDPRAVTRPAALDAQPHVRQHGDFWAGNLGLAESGLVIFDWEDFGAITLHGHDLGVLTASLLDFDPAALSRLRADGQPAFLNHILMDFCGANALSRDDFFRLLPAYLIEFLQLKLARGYADMIVRLVSDMLTQLCPRQT